MSSILRLLVLSCAVLVASAAPRFVVLEYGGQKTCRDKAEVMNIDKQVRQHMKRAYGVDWDAKLICSDNDNEENKTAWKESCEFPDYCFDDDDFDCFLSLCESNNQRGNNLLLNGSSQRLRGRRSMEVNVDPVVEEVGSVVEDGPMASDLAESISFFLKYNYKAVTDKCCTANLSFNFVPE